MDDRAHPQESARQVRPLLRQDRLSGQWRDYSSVAIRPGAFLANVRAATEFEVKRRLSQLGQPVDKAEWRMSPPTVNAYFDPTANNINFPAGILQPPFFDFSLDDAVNYGGIGAVIGHEITHGFDDQGRHYDADGNLADWWTPEDAAQFQARAKKVVEQFNGYEPLNCSTTFFARAWNCAASS